MSRTARVLALTVALTALVGLVDRPAGAHTDLAQASPGPDSVLDAPPAEVILVFTEAVQPAGDAATVTADDGTRVDDGPPVLDPANVLTVGVAPLAAGHYTVSYRVVAADAHVVEGAYGFTVASTPATAATTATTTAITTPTSAPPAAAPVIVDESDDDDEIIGLRLLGVAAGIGLLGGLAAWFLSRRREA